MDVDFAPPHDREGGETDPGFDERVYPALQRALALFLLLRHKRDYARAVA